MGRDNSLLVTIVALATLVLASSACGPATESPPPQAVATETRAVPTASAVALDTPTVPAFVGTYHLRPADYYQGTGAPPADTEYYLTLGEDGSVILEEESVGTGQTSVAARGRWRLEGDGVILEISQVYGEPVEPPEAIRYEYVDGFPVATDVIVGDTFYSLEEARFTIGAGERHPLVQELHRRLASIEWLGFTDPGDDLYTEETRKAVVTFQESQGLYPNGVVNGPTWVLLGNPQPPLPTPTPLPSPTGVTGRLGVADLDNLPTLTDDGKPIVYLTFDDGPSGYTQQVVDLLAKYGAQATFFVLGQQADSKPDLIRTEVLGEHYVGNHTYDHTSLEGLSPEEFMDEVERTKEAILDAAGDLFTLDHDVRYLRPPYGATDANTRQYAADLGYAVVLWDVDPQDWRRPGAQVIADHILRSVSPGAIVLMHDGGGDRAQSVQALGTVLQELSTQGYAFHNIFVP